MKNPVKLRKLLILWYPEAESNRQGSCLPRDFKSNVPMGQGKTVEAQCPCKLQILTSRGPYVGQRIAQERSVA